MKILQPNDRYRGRSYSQWIQEWSNLLVSSSPDIQSASDMFFLRGNIDYESDKSGYRNLEPGKFFDRTGSLGETIYSNTALIIPLMTAMYSINDSYGSRQLLDEEDLRDAVRSDLYNGGRMWLRFKNSNAGYKSLPFVRNDNIENYYFETAMFTLRVSSQSPLIDKFEAAISPGEYETVQGGYFVILTDLARGNYRFHFGSIGRGYYYTDSVYDINVLPDRFRNLAKDASGIDLTPGQGANAIAVQDKEKKTFLHLKTESDIESTSPFP